MITECTPEMNLTAFVEVLKRSQLVESERLRRTLKAVVLSSEAEKPTPKEVAVKLVNAGLLTEWQASKLLKGKYRGFLLGRYVMRRPLGKGGMGVVYEAEHSVLNTRVAVKLLPKAKNEVEKSVSRFLAEARAAAKLNHMNLTRVHDCDVIDGRRFMVMELIHGTDIGHLVQENGPLSVPLALELTRQAALGLEYAHEHGVIHRDVKPQNFLVNKQGQLKVTDLGLALFQVDVPVRHTKDGENSVVGTVDFVAPEQAWESSKVDRRADIYSLGCTLYFMLVGRPPFGSGSMAQRIAKHQTAVAAPIANFRSDCPAPVEKLCRLMMEKKPQDRIQHMADVASACHDLLQRYPPISVDYQELAGLGGVRRRQSAAERARWNSAELLGLRGSDSNADFTSQAGGFGVYSSDPGSGSSEYGESSADCDLSQSLELLPMQVASSVGEGSGYWAASGQPAITKQPAVGSWMDRSVILRLVRNRQFLLTFGLVASLLSIALTAWAIWSAGQVDPINLIKTYD